MLNLILNIMSDKTKKTMPSVGTLINRAYNTLQTPRRFINEQINKLGVMSRNEAIRGIASGITLINGGWRDALQARINSKISDVYPQWIDEKANQHIGKGTPVWSIDKEFGLARYYDASGKLRIASPAGTGLISGQKMQSGDNRTPEGVYTLSAPESGASKKGGQLSFGPYFYRTNHKNPKSSKVSGIGLHGTGFPMFNGTQVSHGCIRIDNDDIRQFHKIAPKHGTNTKIIINK
jgi:lipoprotein-anchoring transpeptidase ErfK/SrfK